MISKDKLLKEINFFNNLSFIRSRFFILTQQWYWFDYILKGFLEELIKKECVNKKVLDYCCGDADMSFRIAQLGASEVIGIDISEVLIETRLKSLKKDIDKKCKFFVMNAERLEFPDNYFDLIYENGALHHLDLNLAYQQLNRVLKPQGKVICIEPLRYNPIINLYRRFTPQLRTEWEARHILDKKDINLAKKYFKEVEIVAFFHLLSILAIIFLNTPLFSYTQRLLSLFDEFLLKLPGIKWLSWQVVFILSKPIKDNDL
ncbi:MAG: class I SAM-dependent methyltransferase [Candidatus Omnitrophica bacterium]|nr:class I SAM-dependent methyltransferase [Candidatus Omnitrophota bacterium]